MKQNKQYKISRILSYISAGISCFSIIFYFVGLFHADYGKENEFFNLIDMFKYSSLNKEGSKAYLVLSVLLILAIIFSVVAAVISFIRAKGTAIASAILLFSAFVFDLAVLVSVCAAIETEEVNISVGFGSVIALLMTLAAFALELISAVFHCRCGCSEKKHSFAGGVLSNSAQPVSERMNFGIMKILSGSCAGYQIPITAGKHVVIGKDPSCCSVIISKRYSAVSRKHCDISFDPNLDMFIVTDFSSNGVFSENGIRLNPNTQTKIRRGTVLTLAKTDNILILE